MSDSTRRPPRRHSKAVYRRRRLVVLIGIAIVIGAIVWLAIAQPWRGSASEPAPEPSASVAVTPDDAAQTPARDAAGTPSAEATESPTESAPVGALGLCDPDVLQVQARTDATEYGADQQPGFLIDLTNTGSTDCELDVGTAMQRFTVTSGSDVWWQSTDCQENPENFEVTLEAGRTVSSGEPIAWDRTRSSVDTCDAEARPAAPGGGATYRLDVEVAGVAADAPVEFYLL